MKKIIKNLKKVFVIMYIMRLKLKILKQKLIKEIYLENGNNKYK
jgi:hypothetical protein